MTPPNKIAAVWLLYYYLGCYVVHFECFLLFQSLMNLFACLHKHSNSTLMIFQILFTNVSPMLTLIYPVKIVLCLHLLLHATCRCLTGDQLSVWL